MLIQRHLSYAKSVAASLYAQRVYPEMEFGDFLQYARIGLIEAIDRFDPDRGVLFTTYATYRIKGSILNGIERTSEDSEQRAHRRRVSQHDRTESIREADRNAESDELFTEMVDVALALALGYILEDSGLWKPLNDDPGQDPYRSLELARLRERMLLILEVLPERERVIIRLHYFDHMEFQAIGELLGLSKSRISQLHRRGLQLVREALGMLKSLNAAY